MTSKLYNHMNNNILIEFNNINNYTPVLVKTKPVHTVEQMLVEQGV